MIQLELFNDNLIEYFEYDCLDISTIEFVFTGEKEIHRKSNIMLDKLKKLPKNKYFIYKNDGSGFPEIKSFAQGEGRVLAINNTRNQYPCVNVGGTAIAVHRLCALAFIKNDDPRNKTEVDHINKIKNDYRLSNLRWVTSGENSFRNFKKSKI